MYRQRGNYQFTCPTNFFSYMCSYNYFIHTTFKINKKFVFRANYYERFFFRFFLLIFWKCKKITKKLLVKVKSLITKFPLKSNTSFRFLCVRFLCFFFTTVTDQKRNKKLPNCSEKEFLVEWGENSSISFEIADFLGTLLKDHSCFSFQIIFISNSIKKSSFFPPLRPNV